MINYFKKLYREHENEAKEIILYLIFGVLTTIVSYSAFIGAYQLLPKTISSTIPTLISWVVGVLFSYFTNRKWVFEKKEMSQSETVKEFFSFVMSRVFSGAIDILIMFIMVDLLEYNTYLIKIISSVIVVVLNYIFSKFFVFKKEKQ